MIVVVDYDPAWLSTFAVLDACYRKAPGGRARSTMVNWHDRKNAISFGPIVSVSSKRRGMCSLACVMLGL
jgi:hypothetical protein